MIDEDESLWDALGDTTDGAVPPAASPFDGQSSGNTRPSVTQVPVADNEDEDIWDIVREMENEASRSSPVAASTTEALSAASASVVQEQAPSLPATNDEGWDEMYL